MSDRRKDRFPLPMSHQAEGAKMVDLRWYSTAYQIIVDKCFGMLWNTDA